MPDEPSSANEPRRAGSGGSSSWAPPTPEELAALLPQYRIEALLGRGGMGAVYKGEQVTLERPVAIKLLPAELAADSQFIARFQREARTLARLQHPGIVTIYDSGQTSAGHLYFVMEYVDGTDLHRVLQGPGLKPVQAFELIAQVCDALHYAHRQGVIHRDIKPANILLNMEGRAKLADFGLARPLTDAAADLTSTNVVMGTPDYMAPEQRVGLVDHRADIFALGVMLYEMLTGRTPRGVFEPPSRKVQVDVRIDDVVLRALQAEPELRYQQVSELKVDLDRIRTTRPVPAEPSPPVTRPRGRQPGLGKPAIAGLAALVLVMIAGAAAFVWYEKRSAREKPSEPAVHVAESVQPVVAAAKLPPSPAPAPPAATPAPAIASKTQPPATPLPRATPPAVAAKPAPPAPAPPTLAAPTPQMAALTTPAPLALAALQPSVPLPPARPSNARVLFLTYAAAYQHETTRRSAGNYSIAENALSNAAAGRFTVEPTQMCGAINRANLRNFDAVVFYTSGELPIDAAGRKALLDFVRDGGGFAGIHSAADTYYSFPEYGEMLGGYLNGHPGVSRVWVRVDDSNSPATSMLGSAFEITHEVYQFKGWSRANSHLLLSLDPRSIGVMRTPALLSLRGSSDDEYPVAWTRSYGRGRVFYTALGHNVADWSDPRFLRHVVGGIQSVLGSPNWPGSGALTPVAVNASPAPGAAGFPNLRAALISSPWSWNGLGGQALAWTEVHFSSDNSFAAFSGTTRVAYGRWKQTGPLMVEVEASRRFTYLAVDPTFQQFTGLDDQGNQRFRGRRLR